jgi:hypothetical protein
MRISFKRLAMGVAVPLLGFGTVLALSSPSSAATSVTVTPNTNITPGQTLSVTASGFTPKATLAIIECSPRATLPGVNQQNECDIGGAVIVSASSTGSIGATAFKVPSPFSATDKLAVCPPTGTPTSYCGVAVANISKTSENGFEAIIYAGQPLPTTTTTSVGQTTTTSSGPATTTSPTTAATTPTTTGPTVKATTATTAAAGTLPVTGSGRRLLGMGVLGLGFVVLGFGLTAGGRRARSHRSS